MSNLKHQTVVELNCSKMDCEEYIANLSSQLSGQKERLIWINKYLFEKTPQEMTFEQVEQKLGHKLILK